MPFRSRAIEVRKIQFRIWNVNVHILVRTMVLQQNIQQQPRQKPGSLQQISQIMAGKGTFVVTLLQILLPALQVMDLIGE